MGTGLGCLISSKIKYCGSSYVVGELGSYGEVGVRDGWEQVYVEE